MLFAEYRAPSRYWILKKKKKKDEGKNRGKYLQQLQKYFRVVIETLDETKHIVWKLSETRLDETSVPSLVVTALRYCNHRAPASLNEEIFTL